MPKATKKTAPKKSGFDIPELDDLKMMGADVMGYVKQLKGKYEKLDPKTKKKILTGLGGVAALLAGLVVAKKISKKK